MIAYKTMVTYFSLHQIVNYNKILTLGTKKPRQSVVTNHLFTLILRFQKLQYILFDAFVDIGNICFGEFLPQDVFI